LAGDRVLPVMIIGISGATWTVIRPMLSEGALPCIQGLMREGAWGVLESVKTAGDKHYRPQTAWPSVMSGKVPERHGITEYFHTYRDMKSAGAWDLFNQQGLSAGIYSTPVLWPPPRLNGFVIPTPHGRDDQAWPPELSFIMSYYRHHQDSKLRTSYLATILKSVKFIPVVFGPGQNPRLPFRLLRSAVRLAMARDSETRALILRSAKLDLSTAIFLSLYRKYEPRFSIFTNFEVDYVSHRYWRYHEPEKFQDSSRVPSRILKRAVKDAYAHMDRCIGILLKRIPAESVVAIVSEHGMAAEERSNEIGRWQYLINANKVKALADIGDHIVAVPIARWIAFRRRDGCPLDSSVGQSLKSITVVESGLPLFTTHCHTEDEVVIKLNIHRGDYADTDDIGTLHISVPGRGVMPIGSLLERVGPRRSAMHAREGVVIMKGIGIMSGFEVKGAVITDILPTLLAAAGLKVPSDLDGRVLDVFA